MILRQSIINELNRQYDDKISTSIYTLDNKPRNYNFKGYKVCNNPSCFCTGKCISRGELDRARAIVKEFG